MNIYSVLSFIAFLLYLQAGAFILHKSARKPVNIIFSILCLAFSIFAFFSTFIFNASDIEQVYFYDRLASFGWTTFPILMVIFFVKISNNKSVLIRNTIKFVLLPLVIISMIAILSDLESYKLYYHYGQTWFFELNRNSVYVYLFVFYLFLSVFLSLIVLGNWLISTHTNRERKQAVIILLSLLVFFIASTLTNIVLPFLNIGIVPALAPINSILWIAGVFYALARYQREVLSAEVISNLILNHINQFIFFIDNNKKISTVNKFTLNNLSFSFNEISSLSLNDLFSKPQLTDEFFQKLYSNSPFQINAELVSSKNAEIPVLLSGLPIIDQYMNHYGYVLIGIDIRQKVLLKKEVAERIKAERRLTKIKDDLESLVHKNTRELFEANKRLQVEMLERQRVEAQIKHDLEEKKALVSEVHHRVKNNIQIIVSLIKMLSYHKDVGVDDSEKILQITERVRFISAIHDVLYSSKKFSNIDFAEFIRKRTEELNNTLIKAKRKKILYKINVSHNFLDIDKAIPCGIIYHELLSNAIKYAFPDSLTEQSGDAVKKNTIHVAFYKNESEYTFMVRDNGVGFPGKLDITEKSSVGLKMVNILTKHHLKGDLKISNSNGITVAIKFS